MAKLVICLNRKPSERTTVGEMRRELARVLSHLDGDETVSFTFSATLENYSTTSEGTGTPAMRVGPRC